jgi:hydrogenase maturation factor
VNHCAGDHCVTCSDEAVAVRVVRLRDGDLADVDVGDGRTEEISVALVDAEVGDVVLVHAKEAIGLVPVSERSGRISDHGALVAPPAKEDS